jgi:hypothetical protein
LSDYYIIKKTQKPQVYCIPCHKEIKKAYKKANPEKVAAEKRRRYHRVKNRPEFRIAKNLRKRLKEHLEAGFNIGSKEDMVGCSSGELRQYLEGQFKEGMTWDNYGEWHIDHIKPVCSFDLSDPTQVKAVNHYTNLRPLWASENLEKSYDDVKLKFKCDR